MESSNWRDLVAKMATKASFFTEYLPAQGQILACHDLYLYQMAMEKGQDPVRRYDLFGYELRDSFSVEGKDISAFFTRRGLSPLAQRNLIEAGGRTKNERMMPSF